MTLTKIDIQERIASELGISKPSASDLFDLIIGTLKEHLVTDGKIMISGFGRFDVREKHEREGRNPKTGERLKISARKIVTFRVSDTLRDQLNTEMDV